MFALARPLAKRPRRRRIGAGCRLQRLVMASVSFWMHGLRRSAVRPLRASTREARLLELWRRWQRRYRRARCIRLAALGRQRHAPLPRRRVPRWEPRPMLHGRLLPQREPHLRRCNLSDGCAAHLALSQRALRALHRPPSRAHPSRHGRRPEDAPARLLRPRLSPNRSCCPWSEHQAGRVQLPRAGLRAVPVPAL